jgi:hypothetical protein
VALHITTKADKATAQAVEARIASGQMAADLPKPDHVARTPVPPFLADSALQPVQAVKLPSFCEQAAWWLANAHLIQQIIDEMHPVHGCALPVAERPIPAAPPAIDFGAAYAFKQAREQAYKLIAFYRGEYNWRTDTMTPQPLRRAA